ncbi:MAG: hypothetical protein HZA50_13275 [Planctomycetes bacterium]|nr:hypothetical protein [Planctomycetota bacterium]
MGKREDYLAVVDSRDCDRLIFSPLTDSLFATSLVGKKWVSDCTLDDQIQAAKICDYHPCFIQGATPDLFFNPALDVTVYCVDESEDERRFEQTIHTPEGMLTRTMVESFGGVMAPENNWIQSPPQLAVADWISRDVLDGSRDHAISQGCKTLADKAAGHGATMIQFDLPYYLYGLPGYTDVPPMMLTAAPDRYGHSMDLAEQALIHMAGLAIRSGIDFVWLSAAGTDRMSLTTWAEIIVPQSQRIVRQVREKGGRVHFHCRGQCRQLAEKGLFNQIQMDVLETLSPPPEGDVASLRRCRAAVDRHIVTRGNIDAGLLRAGTFEACIAIAQKTIEAAAGYPHIVSSSDYLMYGTEAQNVIAVVQECHNAVRRKWDKLQKP